MAEQLDLTTPQIIPQKSTTAYRIAFVGLYLEQSQFVVHVRGSNGEIVEVRVEGEAARQLLSALNTANLSVKSLQRRILEWVAARRAELTGNVSGTPE